LDMAVFRKGFLNLHF